MPVYPDQLEPPFNEFQWNLENGFPPGEFARIVEGTISEFARLHYRDLAVEFPFQFSATEIHLGTEYFCASTRSLSGAISTGRDGFERPEDLEALIQVAEKRPKTPDELRQFLGPSWRTPERFTYVGPYKKPFACYPHVVWCIGTWLKDCVLPDVLERNRLRIERAIPQPPQFNPKPIIDSMWVLESFKESRSGTGFALENVGIVTNDHVVTGDLVAFKPGAPAIKYPVHVVSRNAAIDLAILRIGVPIGPALIQGTADNLELMDHLLVAGFPNYRVGDTGQVTPGLVTAFRTVSAIRRILTNAPIIAGNSGGPVIGADGKVIGVAVTGADAPETMHQTENHGIIPIDALQHLGANS